MISIRLRDSKSDEKLLWRMRDDEAGARDVNVPISFEGRDVFDLVT